MNKEYSNNQKIQKKSFKKYRKYIGRVLLWGAVAVASAFVIPYGTLFASLTNLVGRSLAANITFFTQWGLVAAGGMGAVVNVFKANHERRKIDIAQDEEENIIDSMVNENDKLKQKVENLEKSKEKVYEENTKVKSIDVKEKSIDDKMVEEENEKVKKYVK